MEFRFKVCPFDYVCGISSVSSDFLKSYKTKPSTKFSNIVLNIISQLSREARRVDQAREKILV